MDTRRSETRWAAYLLWGGDGVAFPHSKPNNFTYVDKSIRNECCLTFNPNPSSKFPSSLAPKYDKLLATLLCQNMKNSNRKDPGSSSTERKFPDTGKYSQSLKKKAVLMPGIRFPSGLQLFAGSPGNLALQSRVLYTVLNKTGCTTKALLS